MWVEVGSYQQKVLHQAKNICHPGLLYVEGKALISDCNSQTSPVQKNLCHTSGLSEWLAGERLKKYEKLHSHGQTEKRFVCFFVP